MIKQDETFKKSAQRSTTLWLLKHGNYYSYILVFTAYQSTGNKLVEFSLLFIKGKLQRDWITIYLIRTKNLNEIILSSVQSHIFITTIKYENRISNSNWPRNVTTSA